MHGSFAIFNVSMWFWCDGKFGKSGEVLGSKHTPGSSFREFRDQSSFQKKKQQAHTYRQIPWERWLWMQLALQWWHWLDSVAPLNMPNGEGPRSVCWRPRHCRRGLFLGTSFWQHLPALPPLGKHTAFALPTHPVISELKRHATERPCVLAAF